MSRDKSEIKILVVDDENTAKNLVKNHLINLGFTKILEANDGPSALQMLEEESADLIIADWHMPKGSGIDFYKALQSNAELKNIPFLMITMETDKNKVMKAISMGITNYIIKPVYVDTLKAKINGLLKIG